MGLAEQYIARGKILERLRLLFPSPYFYGWGIRKAPTVDVYFGHCYEQVTGQKISIDPNPDFCHSFEELWEAIEKIPLPDERK